MAAGFRRRRGRGLGPVGRGVEEGIEGVCGGGAGEGPVGKGEGWVAGKGGGEVGKGEREVEGEEGGAGEEERGGAGEEGGAGDGGRVDTGSHLGEGDRGAVGGGCEEFEEEDAGEGGERWGRGIGGDKGWERGWVMDPANKGRVRIAVWRGFVVNALGGSVVRISALG